MAAEMAVVSALAQAVGTVAETKKALTKGGYQKVLASSLVTFVGTVIVKGKITKTQ